MRLVLVDGLDGTTVSQGTLRLSLKTGTVEKLLSTNPIDSHGTVNTSLVLPAGLVGKADLKIEAKTPIGSLELMQSVNLVKREQILITTDKPIYQPGQMMHLRALALDRFTREAVASTPAILEIEDAKGNKVFKRHTKTDRFGVVFADFQLADEVNLGQFKLRVILTSSPSKPQNG